MRLRPGDWVALGLVAEALVIDVVLIRNRHDPISTCVRSTLAGKVATIAIAAHLLASVPGDPLTKAGDWLAARGVIPDGSAR